MPRPPACVSFAPGAYEAMAAHARAAYPEECCGLLTGSSEAPLFIAGAHPCRNVLGRGVGARTAYLLDFRDLEGVERDSRALDRHIAGAFHSHVEAGAQFSEVDRRLALLEDGVPAFPSWIQVVLDVRSDGVHDTRIYLWDAASNEFREIGWKLDPEAA